MPKRSPASNCHERLPISRSQENLLIPPSEPISFIGTADLIRFISRRVSEGLSAPRLHVGCERVFARGESTKSAVSHGDAKGELRDKDLCRKSHAWSLRLMGTKPNDGSDYLVVSILADSPSSPRNGHDPCAVQHDHQTIGPTGEDIGPRLAIVERKHRR